MQIIPLACWLTSELGLACSYLSAPPCKGPSELQRTNRAQLLTPAQEGLGFTEDSKQFHLILLVTLTPVPTAEESKQSIQYLFLRNLNFQSEQYKAC